ncbi:MAG: response regulator [Candidatus Zapsychrus exili]|nr:response regulator [Candidatus Zapsychrus exili]
MPKLLIVDDEEDIREFAKQFFRRRKIDTFTAKNGVEALEVISKEGPDLVLLDITMEGMSGIEVLKKLRENDNHIKVVMVTALEDKDIIRQADELGAIGYVHKPLMLSELEKIVLKELEL